MALQYSYLIAFAAYMLSCIGIISATPLLDKLDERKVGDTFTLPISPLGWTCKVTDQDTDNNGLFSLALSTKAWAAIESKILGSTSESSVLQTTFSNDQTVAVAITVTMEGGTNTLSYFTEKEWKKILDKFSSDTVNEDYPKDIFWTCVATGPSVTSFTVELGCETEDTVPPS